MSINKHTVHFGIKRRSLLKFDQQVTGSVPSFHMAQWIMKSDCMEKNRANIKEDTYNAKISI